jgi:dTDP-4-dehydrorhamnose reductase
MEVAETADTAEAAEERRLSANARGTGSADISASVSAPLVHVSHDSDSYIQKNGTASVTLHGL